MRANELPDLLRALLHAAQLEVDRLDPARAWAVFKAALGESITDPGLKGDMASFQCGRRNWGDGTIAPCVYFMREFNVWDDEHQEYVLAAGSPDEAGLGFTFGFQYPREFETQLGEVNYWSSEFGSVQEFLAAVEADTTFQLALTIMPDRTELIVDSPR